MLSDGRDMGSGVNRLACSMFFRLSNKSSETETESLGGGPHGSYKKGEQTWKNKYKHIRKREWKNYLVGETH